MEIADKDIKEMKKEEKRSKTLKKRFHYRDNTRVIRCCGTCSNGEGGEYGEPTRCIELKEIAPSFCDVDDLYICDNYIEREIKI